MARPTTHLPHLRENGTKAGINGFGRIGRLTLRATWEWPDFEFVAINDPGADAETLAHPTPCSTCPDSLDQALSDSGRITLAIRPESTSSRNSSPRRALSATATCQAFSRAASLPR